MLLNEVKNVDLAPKPTTPEEAVAAYGKKLRKSLEEWEKLGRTQEAQTIRSEIAIVEEYLPKRASGEETEKLIAAFVSANSFGEKQFGQAMGAFMKQHGGAVDAATVNPLLKKALAGR
jgi:uncharacterized protein YqeY